MFSSPVSIRLASPLAADLRALLGVGLDDCSAGSIGLGRRMLEARRLRSAMIRAEAEHNGLLAFVDLVDAGERPSRPARSPGSRRGRSRRNCRGHVPPVPPAPAARLPPSPPLRLEALLHATCSVSSRSGRSLGSAAAGRLAAALAASDCPVHPALPHGLLPSPPPLPPLPPPPPPPQGPPPATALVVVPGHRAPPCCALVRGDLCRIH